MDVSRRTWAGLCLVGSLAAGACGQHREHWSAAVDDRAPPNGKRQMLAEGHYPEPAGLPGSAAMGAFAPPRDSSQTLPRRQAAEPDNRPDGTELAEDRPAVRIGPGEVVGTLIDGTRAFLGIPYARPPVGPLRFAAPKPAPPWQGTFEAPAFGPKCPQPKDPPGPAR